MPYKVGQRDVYYVGEKRNLFTVYNLQEGQVQDYKALKADLKASGQRFRDPEFDPENRDVIGITDEGKSPFDNKVVWKRPRTVNKNAVFSAPDKNGNRYSCGDIVQGGLGDCYYLAAVAIITTNQKLVHFVIPEDNNEDEELGIFHFRFWVKGYFFDVVVDDRIPYTGYDADPPSDDSGDESSDNICPAACQVTGNEIWPALLEKAYAKLYGTYGIIDGGQVNDALEDFTGGIIEVMDLASERMKWENIDPKGYGVFMGLGTPGESDKERDEVTGLIYDHAYSVLDKVVLTDNSGNEVKLLKVRNPHGETEWKGAWADFPEPSEEWETVSADDRARLLETKNDGEFWISIDDVKAPSFSDASMCFWLDNLDESSNVNNHKWKFHDFEGRWEGDGTGNAGGWEGTAGRPQYLVKVDPKDGEKGLLVAALMDTGEKKLKETKNLTFELYKVKDEQILSGNFPFSADVFGNGDALEQLEYDDVKSASDREYCNGARLKGGHYVLLPITDEGREADYLLRITVEGKVVKAPSKEIEDAMSEGV